MIKNIKWLALAAIALTACNDNEEVVANNSSNAAIAAVERLKELNPKSIKFVCLLTCPEGIAALQKAHPDVPIYTAAIDRELNGHGYILTGLGDAGDRIFGTK